MISTIIKYMGSGPKDRAAGADWPAPTGPSRQDPDPKEKHGWPRHWRPYMVMLSGFMMMFNCWGLVMAYGAFLGFYDAHLMQHTGDTQLSLIGGTESFCLLFFSFIVGRLLDTGRYNYILGFAGFALNFLGFFCLSFTSGKAGPNEGNYGLIWLTSGLMTGLGQSCFFTFSSQNAIEWFPHHRYIAVGVTSSGAAFGGLVYPLVFKFAVANPSLGFTSGVKIFAGVVGITTFIAFIFCGPNPNVKYRGMGPVLKASTWFDPHAYRNWAFLSYSMSTSVVYFGYYPLAFHITRWAHANSIGTMEDTFGGTGVVPGDSGFRTFWFLCILNAFSAIGRVGGTVLASKSWTNPIYTHAIATTLAAVFTMSLWPFVTTTAGAAAFCVLFGIFGGVIVGMPAAGMAYIIPHNRRDSLGHWTGQMWCQASVFALAGSLITGALVKNKTSTDYDSVGYWSGACLFVAAGLQLFALRSKRRYVALEEKSTLELSTESTLERTEKV